jgi:hypothetical protein
VVNDMLWLGARQETAKLRKEVQISKAALEASQTAAKKADADLYAAKAATDAATAGKTAADKVVLCALVATVVEKWALFVCRPHTALMCAKDAT